MNKLIAFGDSFTWGSELEDEMTEPLTTPLGFSTYKKFHHSSTPMGRFSDSDFNHRYVTRDAGYSRKTWTALYAREKKIEYKCFAYPGCSNSTISRKFFKFLPHITTDDIVVINWTWIDRWDIYDEYGEENLLDRISHATVEKDVTLSKYGDYWETLRASDDNNSEIFKFYFKYLQSELWNKFETLKLIALVLSVLKNKNIPYAMTSVDRLIIDENNFHPDYIENLQAIIRDDIHWFDDMGFYDWAKSHGFSLGTNNHPLEEAHVMACEYAMANFNIIK